VCASLLAILFACVLSTREAQAAERGPASPIGVHSMLYLTHPFGAKRAMFREAAAVGASTIRVDVELPRSSRRRPPHRTGAGSTSTSRSPAPITCACSPI
jgi:hypothetical protein